MFFWHDPHALDGECIFQLFAVAARVRLAIGYILFFLGSDGAFGRGSVVALWLP